MQTYSWLYLPPHVEVGAVTYRLDLFTVRRLWHEGAELGARLVSLERVGMPAPAAEHAPLPGGAWAEVPITFIGISAEEAQPANVLAFLDGWLYAIRTQRYVEQKLKEHEAKHQFEPAWARKTPALLLVEKLPWLLREREPLDVVVEHTFAMASVNYGYTLRFDRDAFESLEKRRENLDSGAFERYLHRLSERDWSRWLARPLEPTIVQGDVLWRGRSLVVYRVWVERIDGRLSSPQFLASKPDIPSEWHCLVDEGDDGGSHRLLSWMAVAGDQYTHSDVVHRLRQYWLRPEMAGLRLLADELKRWPPDRDPTLQAELTNAYVERRQRVSRVLRMVRDLSRM